MSKTPAKKSPAHKPGKTSAEKDADVTEAMTLREYLDSLAEEDLEDISAPEEQPELWVSFSVGGATFGLPVDQVREVLRVGAITRVPRAPEALRGVTNLRGRVLAVVDLRVRMGMEKAEVAESSRILVAQGSGGPVGLLVDAVNQMDQILPSGVQEPPDRLADLASLSRGVVSRDEGLVVLLDLGALLEPMAAA